MWCVKGAGFGWLNSTATMITVPKTGAPTSHAFQLFYLSNLPSLSASGQRIALNDSFSFVIRDEHNALSSAATVSITALNPLQPVTAPHAVGFENGNFSLSLTALDFTLSDPTATANEDIAFHIISLPANGQLWLTHDFSLPPLTAASLPALAQNVQPGVGVVYYKPKPYVVGTDADGLWFQASFSSGPRSGFASFASRLPIDVSPVDTGPIVNAPSSVTLQFFKQVPIWINITDRDPPSSNLFWCKAVVGPLGMASIFINPAASNAQPPPIWLEGDGISGQLLIEFQATLEVMALAFSPAYLQAQTEDARDTLTITINDQSTIPPGPLQKTVQVCRFCAAVFHCVYARRLR